MNENSEKFETINTQNSTNSQEEASFNRFFKECDIKKNLYDSGTKNFC